MNTKRIFFALLFLCILAGCAAPATPALQATNTAAPQPSATMESTIAAPNAAGEESVPPVSEVSIPAPSLQNSMLGDSPTQTIGVYVPPSYNTSLTHYPVVYFLTGYTDVVQNFLIGGHGIVFPSSLDQLVQSGKTQEMIVVLISGTNAMNGSFYVNSPVSGNWEDFVVKDVISYMDNHYRTIPYPNSRGIAGHSMGGFGAWNIGMRHPEKFNAVYALNPGLFDENGLQDSLFSDEGTIDSTVKNLQEISALSGKDALDQLTGIGRDPSSGFALAYGTAFAPLTTSPYIAYPYRLENGKRVVDQKVWDLWLNGFGNQKQKIQQYRESLLAKKSIGLDCASEDENAWIVRGCAYVSGVLDAEHIQHVTNTYVGTHTNKLGERFLQFMLPFFSKNLASDLD